MQDTPDKVDHERLARVVSGLHGMLRELAQVQAPEAADDLNRQDAKTAKDAQ
jgi:hypothetical protein